MMNRRKLGIEQADLFVSGRDGYHTYRIPSLILTSRGALLAVCEARKHSRSDTGDIDLVIRRSLDQGVTWDEMRVIADAGADVVDNPCPVVDRDTGTVWMPMCWNLADGGEGKIVRGEAGRNVWLMRSDDDGLTWSEPLDITEQVKKPDWRWYATGPGHGIQLESGRLLIPCDFSRGDPDSEREDFGSHVIYSDDHGETWKIGGEIQGKLNECQAVELADGRVCLNMRSYHGRHRRAIAFSDDGGESWSDIRFDETLIEPVCQAAIHRLPGNEIVFSNPASHDRRNMVVRLSRDDCNTWTGSLSLHDGPAAYSDLAATDDGVVCCLYERGDEDPYEAITLARFPREALASDS